MKSVSRRRALQGALAAAGAALLRASGAQGTAEPRVIQMTARRFVYEPNEIPLKVGERVVVAINSVDFVHGMNIPDLGKRLDLVPGRVTRLELQPKAPGVIDFVCDNFCGDGHEEMHGRFVVSA
ncbi:MAG TPA: cupredoxin domain-containing protein [Burkholderiaceae bacterium]|nr:cupredoxin domain-containing protein [Burkholderiaceae bacterium]